MAELIERDTFQEVYKELIEKIMNEPELENGTKELLNVMMVVNKPSIKNFWLPYRNISEKYVNAELKWYWSGSNSCKEIGQYAKLWNNITDDGETSNSAYGYILFKKYGYNQLEQVIELLKKDSNSRRAVLHISDPTLNRITTKDMQCTLALNFIIRNGNLEETVYMRSSDMLYGLPYDWIFFVSIGEYIAKKLNIKLNKYTHVNTSSHIYHKDFDKFVEKEKNILNIEYEEIIKENYEK